MKPGITVLLACAMTLFLVTASPCKCEMVGMLIADKGQAIVATQQGGALSVDGFLRVDIGCKIRTAEKGAQVLLFDDSKAQLLPGSIYLLGRSGVFKCAGGGCILSHSYRIPPGSKAAAQIIGHRRIPVGKTRSAYKASLLDPSRGWQVCSDRAAVAVNDLLWVAPGGWLGFELTNGAKAHVFGPARIYLRSRGIEVEQGKLVVDNASASLPLTIGTPTAKVLCTRSLFLLSVERSGSLITYLGGRIKVRNRVGGRKRGIGLHDVRECRVDVRGRINRGPVLIDKESAREAIDELISAFNTPGDENYHENMISALDALQERLKSGETKNEIAAVTESGRPEDGNDQSVSNDEDWKSEVEGYFENFRAASNEDSAGENSEPAHVSPKVLTVSSAKSAGTASKQKKEQRARVSRRTAGGTGPGVIDFSFSKF